MFLHLLSNFPMKWLSQIICECELLYADDTQLHISTPGSPGGAINVLTQCLWVWMRRNRLRFNPDKCLCILGPHELRDFSSLVLEGITVTYLRLECYLSWIQASAETTRGRFARRDFAWVLLLQQLHLLPGWEALQWIQFQWCKQRWCPMEGSSHTTALHAVVVAI